MLNLFFKGFDKIAGYATVALKNWSIALTQNRDEFLQAPHEIRNSLIAAVIAAQLVVGLLIYFASKSIARPINAAVAGLKEIAQGEGDLTMRLAVKSKDEVGEMARWFNLFIEKLQAIIKQIALNSVQVSDRSTKLSTISQELLSDREDSSQRSTNVATASEEKSANINNVAGAMEQSATNLSMVAAASVVSASISKDIAEVPEASRKISSSSNDVKSNAQDLYAGAEELSHRW